MDSVKTLLEKAQEAGLTVTSDDEQLVVRGPKSAEQLARQLLERKSEVMLLLRARARFPNIDFFEWVLRPDIDGRMGWEPPNLPEEKRWWARYRFPAPPRPEEWN